MCVKKGEYSIKMFYKNILLNGFPLKCNVFDPNKIKIKPCNVGVVGQIVKFEGIIEWHFFKNN